MDELGREIEQMTCDLARGPLAVPMGWEFVSIEAVAAANRTFRPKATPCDGNHRVLAGTPRMVSSVGT